MAHIKAFRCTRPSAEMAERTAALPYDVYNRSEARIVAAKDRKSFLNIDRPETNMPETADMYGDEAYIKARELFKKEIFEGTYIEDTDETYYIYELIMDGRSQRGIVACANVDDYLSGVIRKHENTRAEKEMDRIRHVDALSAQTGPIFLAHRKNDDIKRIIDKTVSEKKLYGFTSEDGITHNVWKINNREDVEEIGRAFENTERIYIADGHHRAASAVKVALKRRKENPGYTGEEEFNYFLSVLFSEDELMIMPYNRVVRDLNGYDMDAFLDEIRKSFYVSTEEEKVNPLKKGEMGMYLNNCWYRLTLKESAPADPVNGLDVSVLQNLVLNPILGIEDPKTDKRIDFVGGIRGLAELERRCSEDMTVAFSMYPTSIGELFDVADEDLLMPPKSTWFEPKLRSGIFIHRF